MQQKSLSMVTLPEAKKQLDQFGAEIQALQAKINSLEKQEFYWAGIVDFLKDQEFVRLEREKEELKAKEALELKAKEEIPLERK